MGACGAPTSSSYTRFVGLVSPLDGVLFTALPPTFVDSWLSLGPVWTPVLGVGVDVAGRVSPAAKVGGRSRDPDSHGPWGWYMEAATPDVRCAWRSLCFSRTLLVASD